MSSDRFRITSHFRAVSPLAVLLALCCCLSAVSGQWPEKTLQPVASALPGFDPKDIVRQIRTPRSAVQPLVPSTTGFDDGEFLIDPNVTLAPAPGDQGAPAVAFDGTNFLVVWSDGRRGMEGDIYGARVTPAGVVLDTAGIAVSTAAGSQGSPTISFDGVNFLVVWQDGRTDIYGDIYGARVTPAGTVLDPEGIAVSTAASRQASPALAFDGENFLVAWINQRSGDYRDIYGARVTPAGDVLDTAGIAISTAERAQYDPALAYDGANFLAVWHDERSGQYSDIYGARVTPAGVVLDTAGIAISTAAWYQQSPSLTFDGENSLVVWQDSRNGSYWDIYGARVTPAGVVLNPAGIAISIAANYQWSPAVALDGENLMVVWQDTRNGSDWDIYGTRVTPAGLVLDTAGIAVSSTGGSAPALAFDGVNCLVTWSNSDIYGTRVTPAGEVLDTSGILVSTVVARQESPALAFDGENYLGVWQDDRSGSSHVYGVRVTQAGVVLDSAAIAISAAAGPQESPVLAFDGENFFVVWQQPSDSFRAIYGARVTPAGVVLDTAGLAISTARDYQGAPVLAFDGENFFVAWTAVDFYHIPMKLGIYGSRVTPSGVVLDTARIAISALVNSQATPALAFDGENFLVVWQDSLSSSIDIYGTRVTPAGVVLDTPAITISAAADSQRAPAIASGGEDFLVAWTDRRSGASHDIFGARVTSGGVVLDTAGIAIATAADDQDHPTLAFDGANFLVVWEDGRSGDSTDIYGSRVTPAGVVFDSGPVVRQEGGQYHPALAHGTGNQMFLVYQGWAGTVGGKKYNTQRIWGKMNPNPGVEETMNDGRGTTRVAASIVRNVLFLPEASSRQSQAASLLDIGGRKVLDLRPGANDVRELAPGVYFVREAQAQAQAQAIWKVIITR